MRPRNQRAQCAKCGYVGPLRAFEVEVALSADDSGDNDWVINYSCPACEAADRPRVLPGGGTDRAAHASGLRANASYDPAAP